MAKKTNGFDPDETPELTKADFRRARSLKAEMPDVVAAFKRGPGRPSLGDAAKERVSLRLSRNIIAAYKATGEGWQRRISDVLARNAPKTSQTKHAKTAARAKRA